MSENTESTFKVPLTKIVAKFPHNNADKLEVVRVYGFDVITKKDQYQIGDSVLYIPVDSVLDQHLEYHLFPADSKIKLHKSRVKQIRIRGLASQGMLIDPQDIKKVFNFLPDELEKDYAQNVKVTKYEPPAPVYQQNVGQPKSKLKQMDNPAFQSYNGLTNVKWQPFMFNDQIVVYQEKIHGTNARAAKLPYSANTLWKKIKKFLGLTPAYEFCYGSNNVQLQNKVRHTGFYGEDIYGKVFKEMNVQDKLKDGEGIYGEIYGAGVQKGYDYGLKDSQKFVLFDVKILQPDGTQKWLNPDEVAAFAKERGFDMVPELYRGPYTDVDHAKLFTIGDSVFAPSQKVREGLVIKAVENYCDERGNKRALKCISEKYLDKEQSDFH